MAIVAFGLRLHPATAAATKENELIQLHLPGWFGVTEFSGVPAYTPIEEARRWVQRFIQWYSHEHRHSGIQFVTPAERHQGLDRAILAQRKAVYEIARAKQPQRWRGSTRNWNWIAQVSLNPD